MEEKIWTCIVKRLTHEETLDSKITLDLWLDENELNQQKYQEAQSLWTLSANVKDDVPEVPFSLFSAQLIDQPKSEVKKTRSFWKYGVAATIAIALVMTGLHYFKGNLSKSPQITWIVKKTEAGKMTKIDLPDYSSVWLNSGSQITYASTLASEPTRLIKLIGEAYFEVKHDEKHPFIVKSDKLTTTVYGTSFSVRAYENEKTTSVSVNSGQVGVMGTGNRHQTIMLLPSHQLTYNSSNQNFIKSTIANADVDAWTKGELVFEQSPIEEVVKTLSRKYNVVIDASKIVGSQCKLTARFNNQPIQVILKALKLSLQIQSTQVKQTIYLKGGNCM